MEFNFEVNGTPPSHGGTCVRRPYAVTELDRFLQDELTISPAEIALVVQKQRELNAPIPMLLWQYGLVSRSGLDRIFDWLETR